MRTNYQEYLENRNYVEILKEPVVYVKIIQLFVCILTFSIVVSFSLHIIIDMHCTPTTKGAQSLSSKQKFDIRYPYDLASIAIKDFCSTDANPAYLFKVNFNTQAQFFVAVGVVTMLYCIAALIFYLLFWEKYIYSTFFIFPDFLVCTNAAAFWFASFCAWASAVNSISQYADVDDVTQAVESLISCQLSTKGECVVIPDHWSYSTLSFTCFLGFVNVAVWYWNSFLVFRKLKFVKSEEEHRYDHMTANTDYPAAGVLRPPEPTGAANANAAAIYPTNTTTSAAANSYGSTNQTAKHLF